MTNKTLKNLVFYNVFATFAQSDRSATSPLQANKHYTHFKRWTHARVRNLNKGAKFEPT